jgi:ATP-dependent DNA helicase PIF1
MSATNTSTEKEKEEEEVKEKENENINDDAMITTNGKRHLEETDIAVNNTNTKRQKLNEVEGNKKPEKKITWNPEQQRALDLIEAKNNIFLSGDAGTGKSHLIKQIIERAETANITFAVTASTGIAATLIRGRTLHNWAGVGLGLEEVSTLCSKVRKNKNRKNSAFDRLTKTSLLIIDEISMILPSYFEKLDQVLRNIRHVDKSFGGIQIVASGDFFQLPPVDKGQSQQQQQTKQTTLVQKQKRYLFLSKAWTACFNAIVVLRQVYRQADEQFVSLLRRARKASLTDDDITLLKSKCTTNGVPKNNNNNGNSFLVPLLHPYRKIVEKENLLKLKNIHGDCYAFTRIIKHFYTTNNGKKRARIIPQTNNTNADKNGSNDYTADAAVKFANDLQAPQHLLLKVGAPVMLVVNLDQKIGLVNGLRGVIISIGTATMDQSSVSTAPSSSASSSASSSSSSSFSPPSTDNNNNNNNNNNHINHINHLISANKSFSEIEIEMETDKEKEKEKEKDTTTKVKVIVKDGIEAKSLSLSEEFIWVKFENIKDPVCLDRYDWKQAVLDHEMCLPPDKWTEWISVQQIPLILAAACSIHKSQGCTFQAAHIYLGKDIFEKGQAYVALSRLASLENLTISDFYPEAFQADPVVKEFYELLDDGEEEEENLGQ